MSRNIVIGKHGHRILELLYRFGSLTQPQLVRATGLHLSNVKRQLVHLTRAGYVAYALDVARWKIDDGPARRGYYLIMPNGVKAGADAIGIENDYLALRHYRRCGVPFKTAHRLLANEYLIAVSEAAENEGLTVEEIYSEACPSFPLYGTGTPRSDRSDTRFKFSRIVPDSQITLDGYTYLLEAETGTHARKELVKKLSDYAGRWRRMLHPNLGERKFHDPAAKPETVVILTPTDEHKPMRDYLREHLPDAPDWADADEEIRTATAVLNEDGEIQRDKKGRIISRAEAGQLIIVSSIDEVRADPLGRVYRPLFRYPEEISDPAPAENGGQTGWGVSLKDAAEISQKIKVPAKPPKLGAKKKLTKKKEKGAA